MWLLAKMKAFLWKTSDILIRSVLCNLRAQLLPFVIACGQRLWTCNVNVAWNLLSFENELDWSTYCFVHKLCEYVSCSSLSKNNTLQSQLIGSLMLIFINLRLPLKHLSIYRFLTFLLPLHVLCEIKAVTFTKKIISSNQFEIKVQLFECTQMLLLVTLTHTQCFEVTLSMLKATTA